MKRKAKGGRLHKGRLHKGALLTMAGFGGLMLIRNRLIPLFGDDYPWSFVWDGERHGNLAFGDLRYEKLKTMKDLVRSQLWHYKTWSGRVPAETLNQLFLRTENKLWFDIINTSVSVLHLLVSDWLGQGRIRLKGISPSLMKALAAGYWHGMPHLACNALWQTGATNYSWAAFMQSLFLLPYSIAVSDRSFNLPVPLAAVSGLLAGWSSEAGAGAACLLSGSGLLLAKIRNEDKPWEWVGFISACVGLALLILAPGNSYRYYVETYFNDAMPEDFSDPGHVPREYLYKPEMFRHFFLHSYIPVMGRLLPLQLPVALYFMQGRPGGRAVTERILALDGTALLIPSVLMLSPEFPPHAACSAISFALAAMAAASEHLDLKTLNEKYGGLMSFAKAFAYTYLGINIAASLIVDADWGGQLRATEAILKSHTGDETAVVPQTVVPPLWSAIAGDRAVDRPSHEFMCIEESPDGIYSKAVAAYYGIGSVRATSGAEHPYNGKNGLTEQLRFPFRYIREKLLGLLGRLS